MLAYDRCYCGHMMNAEVVYRGRTYKTVVVHDIQENTKDEIADIAMRVAGEDRSSLFGWTVTPYDDDPTTASVMLATD